MKKIDKKRYERKNKAKERYKNRIENGGQANGLK